MNDNEQYPLYGYARGARLRRDPRGDAEFRIDSEGFGLERGSASRPALCTEQEEKEEVEAQVSF